MATILPAKKRRRKTSFRFADLRKNSQKPSSYVVPRRTRRLCRPSLRSRRPALGRHPEERSARAPKQPYREGVTRDVSSISPPRNSYIEERSFATLRMTAKTRSAVSSASDGIPGLCYCSGGLRPPKSPFLECGGSPPLFRPPGNRPNHRASFRLLSFVLLNRVGVAVRENPGTFCPFCFSFCFKLSSRQRRGRFSATTRDLSSISSRANPSPRHYPPLAVIQRSAFRDEGSLFDSRAAAIPTSKRDPSLRSG